ncbi:exodeoxyribonuclease VII large subunit [Siccirubricoccus sp. G192]|uniref:exodeoxyribonuclease VII large subunit n=1 Tax=Siccirubricoccus sp. G192 TaxID=2849651 RepID=UPI001C2B8F2D|nr:exodeoxyribonuclease VII large subunit [Siccirubricoccus sp. G192]MBV1796333.1 exodeoxyribonuclease VII large subunit [Siccirubricoccus sp. G192]
MPEYAVSEIAGAIRRTLEQAFGRVRVRGEITELKRYPSGHIYLSLKDENAKLESVIWKTAVPRLGLKPENGVEVIATGRIGTYADRSKYQLVIERLDYAGEGALLARIERLRLRLLEEGLFAAERKRPIPLLPRVIGVVTSERGAVIQDIRTTIARRFPRQILLWPVAVQGAGAAEQIAAAIEGFGHLAPPLRPDVLIVARGGGSLEDLMAFNEEIVVRAAAACPIPLISAVGHETDTTLIDFASDRRAPTPTAAAEMALPARADLLDALRQQEMRLRQAYRARLQAQRLRLSRAERGLPDLPALLETARRRVDDWADRLANAPGNCFRRKRMPLDRAAAALRHPREVIAAHRARLQLRATEALAAYRRRLGQQQHRLAGARPSPAPVLALLRQDRTRLEGLAARLEGVSYQAVLSRGFALVQDAAGATLDRAAAVPPGAALTLTFADGQVGATAEGEAKPPRRKPRELPDQGALL